jgi:uncharacterized membrane protein YjgN (DUF898 family)
MLTNIIAVVYPIVAIFIISFLFKMLNAKPTAKVRAVDGLIVALLWGIHHFSTEARGASLLPYALMVIAGMGLVMILVNIIFFRRFNPSRFRNNYERSSLIVAIGMYVAMLVAMFMN